MVLMAGPNVVFFSTPPYHGTLTRFHAHPSAWLHKLPPNVSFEEGSLCEPLAVALAGIERAGARIGDQVVIWYVSRHVLSKTADSQRGWTDRPYHPLGRPCRWVRTDRHYRPVPVTT